MLAENVIIEDTQSAIVVHKAILVEATNIQDIPWNSGSWLFSGNTISIKSDLSREIKIIVRRT